MERKWIAGGIAGGGLLFVIGLAIALYGITAPLQPDKWWLPAGAEELSELEAATETLAEAEETLAEAETAMEALAEAEAAVTIAAAEAETAMEALAEAEAAVTIAAAEAEAEAPLSGLSSLLIAGDGFPIPGGFPIFGILLWVIAGGIGLYGGLRGIAAYNRLPS